MATHADDAASDLMDHARVPYSVLLRAAAQAFTVYFECKRRRGVARAVVGAAAAASLATNAIEARRLREGRGGHAELPCRLARDLVETAVFSAVLDNYNSVSLLAAPLITETTYKAGPLASVMVAPHVATALAVRRLCGKAFVPDYQAFLGLAAVGGVALRRVERERHKNHEAVREAEIASARTSADETGRRRVALTRLDSSAAVGDSPLDAIGNLFPALDLAGVVVDSALHQVLENNRERLWNGSAIVLSDVVSRWSFEYRRRILRAAEQVERIEYEGATAQVVLTAEQGREAADLLSEFAPTWVLRIGWDARAGSACLRLADDTRTAARTLASPGVPAPYDVVDPAAAVPLLGVGWASAEATRAGNNVGWAAALPAMAAYAVVSVPAARWVRSEGAGAHGRVVGLVLAASAAELATVQAGLRGVPCHDDGFHRLPVCNALIVPSVITGLCWKSLDGRQRLRTAAGFAAVLAVGTAALSRPRPLRFLALNLLLGPGTAAVIAGYYRRHAQLEATREQERFKRGLDDALRRAADEAEREEWLLVRRAADEARLRLRGDLEPTLRARYEAGLDDIVGTAERALRRLPG